MPAPPRLLSFDSLYGLVYDAAVNAPLMGRLALAFWGADPGRHRRAMAAAARCAPGQVLLDCPSGGATVLQ
ncbi:MAG: hypothetical protein M3024_03680, partial [Candidatus Dormibacteraeota bacterium]|nr:hypothetical protein [Candidatus Dormibacteraeota bacterium]